MSAVAIAIICKTPCAGRSKTRLCPPLRPEECAAASSCFIGDLASTIAAVAADGRAAGYAVYTPAGTERELCALLPEGFGLVPQGDGDLGARLEKGIADLLAAGHAGAILVNSDSPTLPRAILEAAVDAVRAGDNVVLSPALDGGYTLIGLSRRHPRLFADMPWSTDRVYALTVERAREIGVPVVALDGWYDVDDGASYAMLEREFDGIRPPCAKGPPQDAPRTRAFVERRAAVSRPPRGRIAATVIIPCLNEEAPIFEVVRDVVAAGVGEVIVVDNGSTDRTAERAAAAGARVVREPRRGYGRACAAGLAAVAPGTEIVCFMDGDGSDVPAGIAGVVAPVAGGEADFVMGSRLRGRREPGSLTPQQVAAGWLAGWLLRLCYGARFTDMSPLRAMRTDTLRSLGMTETTYGWNLEMQMRVAASGLRALEVAVDHRCRRGGQSKVSGNLVAGVTAAFKIITTFVRLAATLRQDAAAPQRGALAGGR